MILEKNLPISTFRSRNNMAEKLFVERKLLGCKFTHPTKKVYNIGRTDYLCDIILDVSGSLFPSAKKVLISGCKNFKVMLDKSFGWSETSENVETIDGVPVIKIQVDFSPRAFNEWHKSLFYGELDITIRNCINLFKGFGI